MSSSSTKPKKREYLYDGFVLEEHDGDTIKVCVLLRHLPKSVPLGQWGGDLGFHVFIEDRPALGGPKGTIMARWVTLHCPFRLLGINAPELNTPAGKDSLAYLKTLLKIGDRVVIRSSSPMKVVDPDKYGDRWLGVITNYDTGVEINAEMVRSGHAKVWDGQGTKPV